MGLLVSEDIAGDAFVVISKMSDSVLHFRSASRVEVVDLSWAERSQERDGATRVTTNLGGSCMCLKSMVKMQNELPSRADFMKALNTCSLSFALMECKAIVVKLSS